MSASSDELLAAIRWRWPSAQVDVRRGTVERWRYPSPAPSAEEIERAVHEYALRSAAQSTWIGGGLLRLNLAVQTCFVVPLTHDVQTIELLNAKPVGNETTATVIFQGQGVRRTVTWGKNVLWSRGVVPVLSTSGNDIVQLYTWTAGRPWYGRLLGADYR